MQLDEYLHLRPQDLGLERLEHVVHRANRISSKDVLGFLVDRGEENDRDVPRALARIDESRRLETVQVRHLHVEQDHRELALEQAAQCVLTRRRAHEMLSQRLEDRLEGEQVLRPVVDDQDVDGLREVRRGHVAARCGDAGSIASDDSIAAISASVSERAAGTLFKAAAGIVGLSAVSGRCTMARPPRSAMRLRPRAPSELAPVSTTPTALSGTRPPPR